MVCGSCDFGIWCRICLLCYKENFHEGEFKAEVFVEDSGEMTGRVIELDGTTDITLPVDYSSAPAFTLLRVTESTEAEGTLVIDEIPFRMDNGQLTFTAERCGLYLIMPSE